MWNTGNVTFGDQRWLKGDAHEKWFLVGCGQETHMYNLMNFKLSAQILAYGSMVADMNFLFESGC